jgi:hypothetical protein
MPWAPSAPDALPHVWLNVAFARINKTKATFSRSGASPWVWVKVAFVRLNEMKATFSH